MRIKSYEIFSKEPRLSVTKSINTLIPSEKSFVIQLSARLKEFPIWDVKDGREVEIRKVNSIMPIRINLCELEFAFESSQTTMNLSNTDLSWQSGYQINFLGKIYGRDIERLSKWAYNRTLSISLKTAGYAIVERSIFKFDLRLTRNQLKLGFDEFESNFLKNTGLNYSYSREFEISSPVISNLSTKPALNELYDNICNLQNNLEHALRILRLSGNALEVLALIRQPLDSIKDLKNKATLITDISKELYVTKKVLEDISPSAPGAQAAAEEVVIHLFQIFDILFDFSSKAFHTKIRGSPQKYKMSPDYSDAEFSLTLALTITNYLINRIRISCQ